MKTKEIIERSQKFIAPYRVTNGKKFRLKDFDPNDTGEAASEDKPRAKELLERGIEVLAELQAYEDMIWNTATDDAPWFVMPADNKWFTRVVVAAAVVDALESLDLRYVLRIVLDRVEAEAKSLRLIVCDLSTSPTVDLA